MDELKVAQRFKCISKIFCKCHLSFIFMQGDVHSSHSKVLLEAFPYFVDAVKEHVSISLHILDFKKAYSAPPTFYKTKVFPPGTLGLLRRLVWSTCTLTGKRILLLPVDILRYLTATNLLNIYNKDKPD